jgi:hypothetical protein
MLNEMQRRIAWDGWFSSDVCALYFAELSGVYRRRQTVATWATLVASSGAFASAIAQLPREYSWLVPLLIVAAAGLSAYSVATANTQRAIDCADMHFRWARLANDYRSLWSDQYAEVARARLDELEMRRAEVSKAGTAYPNKQRRILYWYQQVKQSTAYATATT